MSATFGKLSWKPGSELWDLESLSLQYLEAGSILADGYSAALFSRRPTVESGNVGDFYMGA